jgi:hypothetical protein
MDDASRLVSELQQKLTELDHKVWQYRRDMVFEFDKYAEEVLRGVSKEVSETVSKTIAESMNAYTSLYPDAAKSVESCAKGSSILPNGSDNQRSTELVLPTPLHIQEAREEEGPRSPHEREKEFQGLFTPSYLPLLDSTSRNERRSSSSPLLSLSYENKGKQKEMDLMHIDASTDTRSLAPSPELRRPFPPRRRNTDEVSIQSDWSDSRPRRSALRRLSGSSQRSPRQVRFDVAGIEVLPTSSYPPGEPILSEEPTSLDTSDDEAGSEQIEDVDEGPPPKRISSSQALRALSRSPLVDDGTQWTTVSAPPDGSASVATTNGLSRDPNVEDLQIGNGVSQLPLDEGSEPVNISSERSSSSHDALEADSGGDAEEEPATLSDDEMLDMAPLTRQGSSAMSMLSPINPPNIDDNKSPTASTRSPGKPVHSLETFGGGDEANIGAGLSFTEDDHDDLFHFDETPEQRIPSIGEDPEMKRFRPYSPEPEPEEDSDSTESPISPSPRNERPDLGQQVKISHYSSSPAHGIPKPTPRSSTLPTSQGVVGSYKGKPFSMDIVDPAIHAQAAGMGAITSFVGSVDGRSGFDESDIQSFRASGGIGSFSGTPKSMSERMMMDDILEASKRGGGGAGG